MHMETLRLGLKWDTISDTYSFKPDHILKNATNKDALTKSPRSRRYFMISPWIRRIDNIEI